MQCSPQVLMCLRKAKRPMRILAPCRSTSTPVLYGASEEFQLGAAKKLADVFTAGYDTSSTTPAEERIRQNLPALVQAMGEAGQYGPIANMMRAYIANTPGLKDTGMIDRSMMGAGDAYSSTVGGFREGERGKMDRTMAVAGRLTGTGKVPTGYRPGPADPETGEPTLVPVKGGPAEKLSPEQAGKVALADTALSQIEESEKVLAEPKYLNPIKTAFEMGDEGRAYRKLDVALDAYVRGTTGAALNEQELENVRTQFYPRSYDSQPTRKQKFTSLKLYLKNYASAIKKGRGGDLGMDAIPDMEDPFAGFEMLGEVVE